MPDIGNVDVTINADTWPFDKAIIRSFVATLGSKGRAYLMDLLLSDAPVVGLEEDYDVEEDIGVIAYPIDRPFIPAGTYKLVAVPVEEETDDDAAN